MGRPRNSTEGQAEGGPKFKTVKCISPLRPWVQEAGEEEARPLKMGEIVKLDLGQAKGLVSKGFVTLWDEDMED